MNNYLQKAIDIAGGQKALASAIDVSQPRVWNWLNRDKKVPAEFVNSICNAVDQKIKPSDLRPDIFS